MPTLPRRSGPPPSTTPFHQHAQLDQRRSDPALIEALARRIFVERLVRASHAFAPPG